MTKTELFTEYGCVSCGWPQPRVSRGGDSADPAGHDGDVASRSTLGPIDLAIVAGLATLLYYAFIDPRGALISTVLFAVIYEIAIRLPWQIALGALVVGWVFQLVGHRFEGTKPKFLENLVYLLIGPLYFFEEIFDSVLRAGRLIARRLGCQSSGRLR